MNDQEVFDKVARHLLTQKRKSLVKDDSLSCMYRSHDGLQCAAGCLIPDSIYKERMEHNTINCMLSPKHERYEPSLAALLAGVSSEMLRRLQLVHDRSAVHDWFGELDRAAVDFQLDAGVLKEFECHT